MLKPFWETELVCWSMREIIKTLGQAISLLLNNKQMRNELATKSFKKVDTEYNVTAWMDRLKAVYQSVQGF